MNKIKINMLSKADSVPGQGVGSAYLEQVNLIKSKEDLFEVKINSKEDADIVHVHSVNPEFYLKMSRSKGVKTCYVHFLPHTLDGSINLPKPMFNVFKKYIIKLYKKADYLIVVNPIFIKELELYDIDKDKIIYIPNYVSKETFYPKPKKEIEEIKKKYGVEKDKFIIGCAGQLQTRKGILDFVEIAKQMPEFTFVWAGGFSFGKITDGYDKIKNVYENPPKNLIFPGMIKREEMNDFFNVCDIFFLPSYNELFPMTILEAVNLHKPLLLRDLDLYEDILFNKYLKANNNEDFIKHIKKLYEDKDLYKKMSNASKEISEFYSKENVLDMWTKFYTDIYEKNKTSE